MGVGPHRLGGGLSPPPPRPPGSFTARCRSLAMFQHPPLLPQNPAAAQSPPVGFQPAQKNARFSTTPPARFLSAAGGFLGRHLTNFDFLKIKRGGLGFIFKNSGMARSKIWPTGGSRRRARIPRGGNRAAARFCATLGSIRSCPSTQRQRWFKKSEESAERKSTFLSARFRREKPGEHRY